LAQQAAMDVKSRPSDLLLHGAFAHAKEVGDLGLLQPFKPKQDVHCAGAVAQLIQSVADDRDSFFRHERPLWIAALAISVKIKNPVGPTSACAAEFVAEQIRSDFKKQCLYVLNVPARACGQQPHKRFLSEILR
jgi:hypothetical protein